MTTNQWPNYLYDVQPAEREAFGSRLVFAGERYVHGVETLVAKYYEPPYSSGQGVDVYCWACMHNRDYTLQVLPGTYLDNAGKPAANITVRGENSPALAAALARGIADGLVVVTPA